MNKPFKKALRNIHRESANSDSDGGAPMDAQHDEVAENLDAAANAEESLRSDEALHPERVPDENSPTVNEPEKYAKKVGNQFGLKSAATVEQANWIDPTFNTDVGLNEPSVPSASGGSIVTTDTLGIESAEVVQPEPRPVHEATATATGAIIAKIMKRKLQDSRSKEQSKAEFAPRIREIPSEDEPKDEVQQSAESSTMIVEPTDSRSAAPTSEADVFDQKSENDVLVIDETDLLRASKDRMVIVPRSDKVVIRKSDLISRQEAIAEMAAEAPVVQVTSMPLPIAEAPIVEQYARNPTKNPPPPAAPDFSKAAETKESKSPKPIEIKRREPTSPQSNQDDNWNDNHSVEPDHWHEKQPTEWSPPSVPSKPKPSTSSVAEQPPQEKTHADDEIDPWTTSPPVALAEPLDGRDRAPKSETSILTPPTAFESKVNDYLIKSSLLEQCRALAQIIAHQAYGKVAKTTAFAHVGEADYTREAITALAKVLSVHEKVETLIVDTDVRRGEFSRHFAMEREEGFGEACDRSQLWPHLVKPTSVPGVFFLPAGGCADESLLAPDRLRRLFLEISGGRYDVVLVDAGDVADSYTKSICQATDAAHVIVRLGQTDRKEAQSRIRHSKIHFNGCIITNATQHTVFEQ